jgi:hypothetical protein
MKWYIDRDEKRYEGRRKTCLYIEKENKGK